MSSVTILSFVFLSFMPADPDETSHLSELIALRSKIKKGELILNTQVHESHIDPDRSGMTETFHYYFDLDTNVFRMDTLRDNDASYVNHKNVHHSLTSYNGHDYKIIDEQDTLMPLREYRGIQSPIPPETIDPRILGLCIDSTLFIHGYSLEDAERIASSRHIASTSDGHRTETFTKAIGSKYSYTYSESGNIIAYEARNSGKATPLRIEAKLTYKSGSQIQGAFPERIEFRRYEANRLVHHETAEIETIQLGEAPDSTIFEWKSLNPRPGASLVINGNYANVHTFWNGDDFEPIPAGYEGSSVDLSKVVKWKMYRTYAAFALAFIGVMCLVFFIYRLVPKNGNKTSARST